LYLLAIEKLPFLAVRRTHERNEHHDYNAISETAHGDQPIAFTRNDQGSLEERFIQIGEVKTIVFGDVGEALRFIPNDLHEL
jgi:hypothetical protein